MGQTEVAQDLEAVGLSDPNRLLYTFLVADEELAAYLGSGPLNTDDRPILSYSTYGATYQATIGANLLRLLACRGDVARFVKHPTPPATMLRHYAASNQAILGHIAHLSGAEDVALSQYTRAAALLPADAALQELVHAAALSVKMMPKGEPKR
jgi:hypothetical protein